MDAELIKKALADITCETDPTLKSLKRVLVSVYPQPNDTARACARILAGVALRGQIAMNWNEVGRVARLPEYRNLEQCEALVKEVADELKIKSPLHPAG